MPVDTCTPSTSYLTPLVHAAGFAPSSHNAQPWRFRLRPGWIELHADPARTSPVSDPDERELRIACGGALFAMRCAAAHAGWAVRVHARPDPAAPHHLADLHVYTDRPPEAGASDDALLYRQLDRRHMHERPFTPRRMPAPVLEALCRAAAREGAWLGVLLHDAQRGAADLVAEADAEQWADPRWREEVARWIRTPGDDDGTPVPALAAPFARAAVRRFDFGQGAASEDRALAGSAPVLVVLGTTGDAPEDHLRAGMALLRVLLLAAAFGAQASLLNQPVELAPLRFQLADLLGTSGFPQCLVRLGYPGDDAPIDLPRRPTEALIDP